MDLSSDVSELCLVLVGSIGCGKSLTADTLLAQSSGLRASASSRECQVRRALSEGRHLSVVETPRWYWRGGQVEDDIQAETRRALGTSAPGQRVFIILIPVGEFTEMEQRIPDQLEKMFGCSVLDHTLVLLTCGDYLMGRSLEQYLRQEEGLPEVVRRCHGRCRVINNRRPHDRQQVVELLEEVEQMIQRNGGFTMNRHEEIQENSQLKISSAGETSWNDFRNQRRQISTEETESDVMIESRLVNGLNSQRHEHEEAHVKHSLERTPSFKLNKEGAILSNMLEGSEVQNNPNFINTIHHSIRKVVDGSETFSAVSFSSDAQTDPSFPELRMVLLGRRGSGKSSAGNIVLGCEVFEEHRDDVTLTQQCVKGQTVVQNQQVSVVDTPDWFESERSPEEVRRQISRCMVLSAPGPHVFLMCVPVDRPAHSELPALHALEAVFGPDAVRRHTVLLFTRSDLLAGEVGSMEGVEAYIASKRPEMLELVQKCSDRYHVLRRGDGGGVTELLDKVRQTVRESGGGFYSYSLNQEAGSRVQRRQEEISTVWRERQRDREDRQSLSHSLQALREMEEEEELTAAAEKNIRLDCVALLSSSSSAPAPSLLRSVCEKAGSCAKRVPKVLAVGALTGAALGVFLAGAVGGAVGAVLGTAVSEVGRRRYNKQKLD